MAKLNIVAFSGSLRVASTNTGLLRAIKEIAGDAMNITIIDIGSLPLYNQDLEATSFPAVANTIKSQIRAADGIIIATPEFNRSIPGVLKNLIDWTSDRTAMTRGVAGRLQLLAPRLVRLLPRSPSTTSSKFCST